jgi:nucleotide-binding universal stress UspA family protein
MSTFIVGVDRSDASRRAVELAREWASESGSGRLVLAHVIPWSPYSFTSPEDNEERPVRREEELTAAREQVLEPLVEFAGDTAKVETVAVHGHPAEKLNEIARQYDDAHVLVGRTGESRLRALFFGSLPAQLIQIAEVPVTVVP